MQHCVIYKLNIPYIYDNDFNYRNCVRNLQTYCAFFPLEVMFTSITSFQIYILLYTAKILTCLLLEFYICIYRKSHKKSLFSFVGPYLGIITYDTILGCAWMSHDQIFHKAQWNARVKIQLTSATFGVMKFGMIVVKTYCLL